jgi:hypothetical protein
MSVNHTSSHGDIPVSSGSTESTTPNPTTVTGIDELNLAEFPLAMISERQIPGQKTLLFEETIFDRKERKTVQRRWIISGSDRYGLPTAKDDEILLACLQLSKQQGIKSREVEFSRYELLRILGLSDDSKNYNRIELSLRRWKGVSIFSDRAFYDHKAKSWVNRDFGIIDNLIIYRRESSTDARTCRRSRFVWNEVLFESFQAGYLKKIDWNLYRSLRSPIAKRLYRFLDKRFYLTSSFSIDLRELAVNRLGVSASYNSAQFKRLLQTGIQELEQHWHLTPLTKHKRFIKQGRGRWQAVFSIRADRAKQNASPQPTTVATGQSANDNQSNLIRQLEDRGVELITAQRLVSQTQSGTVEQMIRLFDWYNQNRQKRGPGFLINSIKNPDKIKLPDNFVMPGQSSQRQTTVESRNSPTRLIQKRRDEQAAQVYRNERRAFLAFWDSLSDDKKIAFEQQSYQQASPTTRDGLKRAGKMSNELAEHYRMKMLMDYYMSNRLRRSVTVKSGSRET